MLQLAAYQIILFYLQVNAHYDIPGKRDSETAVDTVEVDYDGDTKAVWPKCAAWFLGPKVG